MGKEIRWGNRLGCWGFVQNRRVFQTPKIKSPQASIRPDRNENIRRPWQPHDVVHLSQAERDSKPSLPPFINPNGCFRAGFRLDPIVNFDETSRTITFNPGYVLGIYIRDRTVDTQARVGVCGLLRCHGVDHHRKRTNQREHKPS